MKIKILLLVFFCYGTAAMIAQNNCSRFYPMEEGTAFEYTIYDKKGKTDGISSYKVATVDNNGDSTTATMAISFIDDKGKNLYNSDYSLTCTGNIVAIDYESLIPQQMIEQYGEMDMEISGTDLEIPNDLFVGQELEDSNVAIKISMGGINMNMKVDMTNRKVEKQESVTTPAGTFNCYVLYSDTDSKVMMVKQSYPSRVWVAEGVGMVKQETYKSNGKLMNSMLLTKFTK